MFLPVGAIHESPAVGSLPGRRRCEASRRRFRRRRRCETKRSDLGWRFSFFSHSFFCKKKKEWEKEKACSLRWISFFPKGRGRCAGPSIFLVLGKKDTGEKEPLSLSEGFLGPISAHYRSLRSLWRSVGRCLALLTKPSENRSRCFYSLSFRTGAHTGEESYRPRKDFSPVC